LLNNAIVLRSNMSSALSSSTDTAHNGTNRTTTVLDRGTVESRGFGAKQGQTRDDLATEIESFLQENTLSWRTETRCFWSIFIFVTTLPGPSWVRCHPGFLMKGMCYFPVVGAIVGSMVAIVFDFGRNVLELPAIVAAALCTAASFRWTGCLHEDGLADSADGIGGGWTRPQILRIMTDTRLGTFGSAALILYVFTKLELLAALDTSQWKMYNCQGAGPALVVCNAMARTTAAYLIHQNVYVEEDGPKSHFYSFMIRAKFLVSLPRVLCSATFGLGLAAIVYGPVLAWSLLLTTWVCAEFGGYYGRYKLGGVMGDYLGAVTCITEVTLLATISTRQSVADSLHKLYLWYQHILASPDFLSLSPSDDTKLWSMLRFILAALVLQLWGWAMTPPKSKHSEVSSRSNVPSGEVLTSPSKISPGKAEAQKILSSPCTTILEKYKACCEFLDTLAKPVGSLGALEEWAARLCTLQGTMQPQAQPVGCIIFAGDHGVAASPEHGGEACSL
jgi:adenosylcobinamide-GDP ribazoletransferase